MAVTSEELNFLVYRYLQESGFTHSAFTFSYESFIHKSNISHNDIPPGALISFVQKGLQYLEMEANVSEGMPAVEGDFAGFTARDLLTQNVDDLRRIVADRRERREAEARPSGRHPAVPTDIPDNCVQKLRGHESEVFICSWNPTAFVLVTGSGDATARLWDFGASGADAPTCTSVLRHGNPGDKSKDVTAIDWISDGSLLATGTYDGVARVWSKDGELLHSIKAHQGPMFTLRWNKKGDSLLSGGVDKTSHISWNGNTGSIIQEWQLHEGPCLDVEWRNNNSYASCGSDKLIFLCKLGEAEPLKRFDGHTNEVNTIKWDPTGKLLASCSDDCTAKIWKPTQDRWLHDLKNHKKEIYTIRWSPTGLPSGSGPARPILVTASFDHSIRLWDGESGQCVSSWLEHQEPVYSVAFSPDGQYLASGSFDSVLHVWRVTDGTRIRTYTGSEGGIFEVSWAKDGNRLAACSANDYVTVLNLRMA